MKRLDYTYSMLITVMLTAIGTYFATLHFTQTSKTVSHLSVKKQPIEIDLAQSSSKSSAAGKNKNRSRLNNEVEISGIGVDLLLIDRQFSELSRYLLSDKVYQEQLSQIEKKFTKVANRIDQLAKSDSKYGSTLKISHLKFQQQRVATLAELKHMFELNNYLKKINNTIPELRKKSLQLLAILEKKYSKVDMIQKATYQLMLLERIENALNRAIRFNIKIAKPEILIDRAKRDLAVFVTVVDAYIAGNATQGIEVVKDKQASELLTAIRAASSKLEANIKPIIDSRLRIAKLKISFVSFFQSSSSLQKILNPAN